MLACGYCKTNFEREDERAFHWFCDHIGNLDEEDYGEALNEYTRRWDESEVNVDVDVVFPWEVWCFIVAAYGPPGADPSNVDPSEIDSNSMGGLVEPNYHFSVEKGPGGDG